MGYWVVFMSVMVVFIGYGWMIRNGLSFVGLMRVRCVCMSVWWKKSVRCLLMLVSVLCCVLCVFIWINMWLVMWYCIGLSGNVVVRWYVLFLLILILSWWMLRCVKNFWLVIGVINWVCRGLWRCGYSCFFFGWCVRNILRLI